MQRQPNEYWFKYMLLFSGMSHTDIARSAELQGMRPPPAGYLAELNRAMAATKPRSLSLSNSAAQKWLRGNKLISMVRGDADVVGARSVLGDSRLRSIVEPLLLSNMPDADVALYAAKIVGTDVQPRAVTMYRHYFWNKGLLSLEEWYLYLHDHPNSSVLRACFNQDAEFALWKVGYRVELAQDDVLKAVFHESAMRFLETNGMPNNRSTALTAKFWAENVLRSAEILGKSGDGVREVLTELRTLSIQLGRRDISSLEEVREMASKPKKKTKLESADD